MDAPKRITLEDTGIRRYPKGDEFYIHVPSCTPENLALFSADDYDGEWGGHPEDFAIYRIAEVQ